MPHTLEQHTFQGGMEEKAASADEKISNKSDKKDCVMSVSSATRNALEG